jgi:hypothetical protein
MMPYHKHLYKYSICFLFVIITLINCISCHSNKHILCIGDSLLSGYKISKKYAPVNLISKRMHNTISNHCIIGLTTDACTKDVEKLVEHNTTHVIQ